MQGLFLYTFFQTIGLLLIQSTNIVKAGKKDISYCDVCRAVVRESNWKVSQVDPKKSIQVGSFRVDPNGNQPYINEKKFARSESHIEDIFESICDRLRDYAELTKEDGAKEIVRYVGMDGTRLNTEDYVLDRSFGNNFRYRCEDFLEDHMEEVMSLLQRENLENYENIICGEATSVCTGKQLSQPVTELPEAKPREPELSETEDEEADDENHEEKEMEESASEDFTDSTDSTVDEKEEL